MEVTVAAKPHLMAVAAPHQPFAGSGSGPRRRLPSGRPRPAHCQSRMLMRAASQKRVQVTISNRITDDPAAAGQMQRDRVRRLGDIDDHRTCADPCRLSQQVIYGALATRRGMTELTGSTTIIGASNDE